MFITRFFYKILMPAVLFVFSLSFFYTSEVRAWGYTCECTCSLGYSQNPQVLAETHGNSVNRFKLWMPKKSSTPCWDSCKSKFPNSLISAGVADCKFAY